MVNTASTPVSVTINVQPRSTDGREIRFVYTAPEDGTFADLRAVLLEDEIIKAGEKSMFLLPDGRFVGKSSESHLKWHTTLKDSEVTIVQVDGETGNPTSNLVQDADEKSTGKDWSGSTALHILRNPATPSGPPNILPGSSVAVINTNVSRFRLFYQNTEHRVAESEYAAGSWTSSSELFNAAPLTPLSAISWDKGAEIRVYYLDKESILQEHCFSSRSGSWYAGGLSAVNVKAAKNSAIAALVTSRNSNHDYPRIYFQDTSNAIQEYYYSNSKWTRGAVLPVAHAGTALAATSNSSDLRIYYQAEDLSIREHRCSSGLEWHIGMIGFGKAPEHTPISALGYTAVTGHVVHRVFWVNADGTIVQREDSKWPWSAVSTVVGPVTPSAKFVAAQWGSGRHLRVYYAPTKDSIVEVCDEGNGWFIS